jgi:hypothetical protein
MGSGISPSALRAAEEAAAQIHLTEGPVPRETTSVPPPSLFLLTGPLTPLYEGPDAASMVKAKLPAGTTVKLLEIEKETDFVRVQTEDGKVGYLSSGAPWI